ncbi:MAG: hypothetical protein IPN67_03620 [Bacteroidales bacterium]|nr:hypothetical protein [Bacteroidales bacterium]
MDLKKYLLIISFILFAVTDLFSQSAPAADENINYLMTFGGNSNTSWGDDDFCQIFFCIIPYSQTGPVYIRVYDPDTGGDLDEGKAEFNTSVNFSIYGGKDCWSDTAELIFNKSGNYKNGYLLASKSFETDPQFNKKWYSFGPFNPSEGKSVEKLGGRVFKIIAQGISGDDGNLYKYFLSTSAIENVAVEGGNLFTYKYHFRLSDDQKNVCQIYPFVDDRTISIQISNFDWDDDGIIRIFSVAKNGILCPVSGEDNWKIQEFPIVDEEKNSTIEIQFLKNQTVQIKNNNVVVTVRNQYGISLPFYVVPIGGVPVYSPKIRMR